MPILTPFAEVALLLVMAAGIGLIGTLARQPLIVSFIAVGLIAGPSALDVVRSDAQIALLSELGIAVLLFLVGIKLDVKLIRSLGVVSVMTGLGQVVFTAFFGYLIGLALGLGHITSLYVAVALTFSSTIIIVKLLSDKREIDALHGQIALGFLIVQDLVVVLAMIVLSAIGIGAADGGHGGGSVAMVLASGLALVAAVVLFVRYAADPLTERLARAPELLVIFAIALAAMFAAVGDFVGLGKEVGGADGGRGAGLYPLPRDHCRPAGTPARFPASVLLHRAWGHAGPVASGYTCHRGDPVLAVRADRQPVDRAGDHGGDGLPQAHRLSRRADGGADQRVLVDLRRHGCVDRACD
jgi:hypothetical protein